ncbi:hypothetical protein PQ469_27760 [Mucilaginibacter sp. KACC 22773]|uniref:hypothetical protein n=1 Tax=Mucilaginibacter sp. KACC 22773 TaxID=3025671 RepID=UPI002366ECFF|nr:hypothetical protein [Mucilaginibacter sp. KACC 22773]WDF77683.1 hypothetical protein PQ469_27725 [Mucilaginibacter sp. KACC 22773]WDF77690.1 hypothetical protein PQ469_27760 [Mucilaginibacter sp. KACC 22773]
MNNQQSMPKEQIKELIKPRKVEDVYSNTQAVEAFCREFGSGTDCRGVNAAIESDEDSLLF